ncbi:MAG: type III secretion system chaperone [Desulfovibrio sp.]|jgi:hypothetical protein|nr:type III secretion system chaperone [Desulfovibrio sp.]
MRFDNVLAELGRATGLDGLAPDADGGCCLNFDGEQEVTLIQDREEDAVFLYGIVAGAEALREAETCRLLLAASCLGADTGGAAFALYGNSVILWKRCGEFADRIALEKTLNDFLAQLARWKEKLADAVFRTGGSASPGISVSRSWLMP